LGFESLPRSLVVRAKLLSLTLALLLGAGLAACGGDDSSDSETAATPSATETATPAPQAGNVAAIAKGITKDTGKKPKVVTPQGDPPSTLVIRDVVKGKGPKAKPGDRLTMQYVGVSWSNGQQFDASWDRGQPFPFQLGAGMVIPGWDKGMVGMRQGGRRLLVIPPDLGYGPQGSGPIGPNETLVFVVDLVKLQKS
jgi:peptidylprolyl isomerase